MRKIIVRVAAVAALAASAALSGCSAYNSVIGALSSPQTTQAAANVQAFTTGFVCGLGSLSGLASSVQSQLKAQMNVGNAMIATDTGIVYVVATSICLSLGGKVAGVTPVAVPSTATTAAAALP